MINQLPPPPRNDKDMLGHSWQDWLYKLWNWTMANYPSDFYFEVMRGNIANTSGEHILGFNNNGSAGTETDIWFNGGQITYPIAATLMSIVSSNANDTGAGSGANTVSVTGLDANWNLQSESVALTGTVAASTTKYYIRVLEVKVTSVGAYTSATTTGSNIGNITISISGGGAAQGYIAAGIGRTTKSHYTVPNGYTAYVPRVSLDVESGKPAEIRFYRRENADDVTSLYSPRLLTHRWVGAVGSFQETGVIGIEFPSKTDIWFTTIPGTVNTAVTIDYDIILVNTG